MTRDEIVAMAREADPAREAGRLYEMSHLTPETLERFAALVAAHEREECAKICETMNDGTPYNRAKESAEAIRARGDT